MTSNCDNENSTYSVTGSRDKLVHQLIQCKKN